MRNLFNVVPVAILAVLCVSCDGGSTGGGGGGNVSGVWSGTLTVTSADGNCTGVLPAAVPVSNRITVTVTQSGSSVTATGSNLDNGNSIALSGTIDRGHVVLNGAGGVATNPCGNRRVNVWNDNGGAFDGQQAGNRLAGTWAESWLDPLGETSLTQRGTFDLTR